jgi:O-antigen/teichoic acid export membrane protein
MIARYFNVLFRMEGKILLYTAESILMQLFYKLFYVLGIFFKSTNPVPAMAICSVLGMGVFALFLCIFKRKTLISHINKRKNNAYKKLLPYGVAVAPTAIIVVVNGSVPISLISAQLGNTAAGIYSNAFMLSNIVSMVQLGFASFWGPYMFANYKTEKARIMRVHEYINLLILCFFCLLIAFEDLIFVIFPLYAAIQPIFPLMMLSAVFTIMCETTVYGNAIAKKPIFDTIGFLISFIINIAGILLLLPVLGLHGAALSLAVANGIMAVLRTLTAQKYYKSIKRPIKTIFAVFLAILLCFAGTVFSGAFLLKLICAFCFLIVYCILYRKELLSLINLGLNFIKKRNN